MELMAFVSGGPEGWAGEKGQSGGVQEHCLFSVAGDGAKHNGQD